MPAIVPSRCSSVSSILPTQASSSQRGSTLLEGRPLASSVAPGHQPSNVTDQPHTRRDVSAEGDRRFPPPEPTCLPQRFHDKLGCTRRLVPGSDDCRCLGRVRCACAFAIALTSDFVAGSRSACNTTSVSPHVSNVCATVATVSTDESFVDCIAITAPVE